MARDDMLTIPEVLAELRVSRSTFYEWKAKKRGPRCIKLPGGALRVRRSELTRFINACEEAA